MCLAHHVVNECQLPFVIPGGPPDCPLFSVSATQLLNWPSPVEQLALAFFKTCFNRKKQNLATEEEHSLPFH